MDKFKSRKFLMCLAQVLMGIGTSIAGMCLDNEVIILVGAICTSVATGIYTFCEAWIDGKAVEAPKTAVMTEEEIENNIL